MFLDLFMAVRAFLLGTWRVLDVFALKGKAGRSPGSQAAAQRPCLTTLLSKKLRHTGAGGFLWSSAVGDDLFVWRQAREESEDFGWRPSPLQRPNNRLGSDTDRCR